MFKTLVLIISSAVTLQAYVVYNVANKTYFPLSVISTDEPVSVDPGVNKIHTINPLFKEIRIDSAHGNQIVPEQYFKPLTSAGGAIPTLEIYFDKNTNTFNYKVSVFDKYVA